MQSDLLQRFQTRFERFEHGYFAVEMVLPKAADELIDVSEFNVDERLPYWADLWPSARVLARYLLDREAYAGNAIELGCGVALPSLALRWKGVSILATDYYQDALDFAKLNAERNRLAPLDTQLLDWRDPLSASFALVLAADVLYERRNAVALASLLPRLVAAGGEVLLADPGRTYLGEFRHLMETSGWTIREVAVADEPIGGEESVVSQVSIMSLTR